MQLDNRKVAILARRVDESNERVIEMLTPFDLTAIEQATIETIPSIFNDAPEGSRAQYLAMEKWLSLCTTRAEAREAYDVCSSDSQLERLAVEKWLSLCTTMEQAEEVYNASSCGGYVVETLALQRMHELLQV